MKIDSLHKKTLFELAADLVELTQRDPWKYLGKDTHIEVKNADSPKSAGWLARHDPEEYQKIVEDQQFRWGEPDVTRDAHDYEPE